jgi:hypothetical protein
MEWNGMERNGSLFSSQSSAKIRTTIHQSLENFTFATHKFSQIADAVDYLTDKCITSEVMQPLIDE